MEKLTTFTQFEQKKHPHQLVHNCVFMHNCYSNRAYMHGYCSMCIYYFINFRSHLFFLSLLCAQPTNSVFLSSSSFSSDAHKQTHPHPHPHTNTSTQTNQHRDTQTHPHTNKLTRTNQQRDRSELVGLDQCLIGARGSWPVIDWSSWVLISAWLELVLIGAYGTIGARGSFAWTELDRYGSYLIGAREIWPKGRVDLCWYRDG